jgi:3',5'-cyclic AMP phosphodiesterase CpdA
MRIPLAAAGLVFHLAVLGGCAGGPRPATLVPAPEPARAGRTTLLLVADNQEHMVTGTPLKAMSPTTEAMVTSVALRSPLANVGGRALFREALRFGREQGADLVLHLGDAADVSCPDEFTAVLDALDAEAGDAWFMAPGNHDGIMAGTYVRYQPRYGFHAAKDSSLYTRPPLEPIERPRAWHHACRSPSNETDSARANILTTGDAIERYVARLRARPGARSVVRAPSPVTVENTVVECRVEEISLPVLGYEAVAHVCPRTPVRGATTWVGPYASFLVQKLDVAGTRIVILGTAVYPNPTLLNVGLTGSLSQRQREVAERFLPAAGRANAVVAGHHPLEDLRPAERAWVAARAARYVSGHVHRSTTLLSHTVGGRGVTELNIGSTLDHPAQTVVARLDSASASFRVAGADTAATRWAGFLRSCEEARTAWMLPEETYTRYTKGLYVAQVLAALRRAAPAAPGPPIDVPAGDQVGDWMRLDRALQRIATSEGEARRYWACQAFYASEATRYELSFLDRVKRFFGAGNTPGAPAVGGWFAFDAP